MSLPYFITKFFREQPTNLAKLSKLEKLDKLDNLDNLNGDVNIEFKEKSLFEESPAQLSNIEYLDNPVAIAKWFADGHFWGISSDDGRDIYKSEDGITWEQASRSPTFVGQAGILMVSETGRIIAGSPSGSAEVYVSDENQEFGSEPAFQFTDGNLLSRRGHFIYKNIIGISEYSSREDRVHEAFLSTDNGETWKKVFDKTPQEVGAPEPTEYHIHDFEYCPYSGRLYIWIGDVENINILMSDDWGETWEPLFDYGVLQQNNATAIVSTPNGIVCGSDASPSGLYLAKRTTKNFNYTFETEDWDGAFYVIDDSVSVYGSRRWTDREKGIYLMPFYARNGDEDFSRLLYSQNGYDWYQIWKDPRSSNNSGRYGLENISYGNSIVLGQYRIDGSTQENFRAELNFN